ATETAARGLVAVFAVDAEDAHRALSSTPPPGVIVLEATGEKSLVMLERAAARAPTIVLAAPGAVDRVEVARRGGRGLLDCQSTTVEIVDAAVGLRKRLRSAGTTVLAVDDDAALLDVLRPMLSAGGLRVETCADPALFWERLSEVAPDLVVMDYDMPGIMGSDLARSMRNDARYQTVPIMFLTADGKAETVQRIFEAGADDYVAKPFTGPELIARISNRLERVRLLRTLADTDPLTGLANRDSSVAAIETQLALARRAGEVVYLAVLDVDDFQRLNDAHGREVGDAVLRAVGGALRGAFRGEDVLSRGDGDEFVIGMYGMQESDARERIGALLETVRGHEMPGGARVTLSAGLAGFPRDGEAVDMLYRAATRAIRCAKAAGQDQVRAAEDVASDGRGAVDVVIVEDDDALAALLQQSFQTRGYAVRLIADGEQALTQLGGPHPAVVAPVILLDWDLPGLEGIDVLRSLAAGGLLVRSRVIMLTARTSEREVVQALEAGAVDHVAKPFSVPVLMQRVRRAMDR
ncbi:MAG: response regulator, partial [Actinobacteria bacterium]|nr:response regulator [Actinomycetota bacterium]